MKKLSCLIAVLLLVLCWWVPASTAASFRPLDSIEAATYGASHVQEITYEDMAEWIQTNGTHGVTSSIPAGSGLTFVGMTLPTAFNDSIALGAASAVTNSLLLTVGDGSDVDYYMTSTQIAADGTEVFVQFAPIGGVSITPQTLALTGTVQNVAVVTNVATALLGDKYFSSAGSVIYTFTGAGGHIPADLEQGAVRLFWRLIRP